jgi:hypothetical protein
VVVGALSKWAEYVVVELGALVALGVALGVLLDSVGAASRWTDWELDALGVAVLDALLCEVGAAPSTGAEWTDTTEREARRVANRTRIVLAGGSYRGHTRRRT